MRADNSHHLVAAARRRAEQTRKRAVSALRRLDATGRAITFDTVAREAGVSRSWLYSQHDLRTEIERLRARRGAQPPDRPTPGQHQASDASLLRRLQAATERARRLEAENRELREALAHALGQRRAADVLGEIRPRDTPMKKPSKIIGARR